MLTAKQIEDACKRNNVKLLSTYRGEGSSCTVSCNVCGNKWKTGLSEESLSCSKCDEKNWVVKTNDEDVVKTYDSEFTYINLYEGE
jgi:hypothetical protein